MLEAVEAKTTTMMAATTGTEERRVDPNRDMYNLTEVAKRLGDHAREAGNPFGIERIQI